MMTRHVTNPAGSRFKILNPHRIAFAQSLGVVAEVVAGAALPSSGRPGRAYCRAFREFSAERQGPREV